MAPHNKITYRIFCVNYYIFYKNNMTILITKISNLLYYTDNHAVSKIRGYVAYLLNKDLLLCQFLMIKPG